MMKLLVALTVVGAMLGGCGAVAERAAEEMAEQAIERAAESEGGGDVDIEFGGGTDLPEGLTTELPDGYTVVASSTMSDGDGSIVTAGLTYPADRRESLVEHFDGFFAGQPDTSRQESNSDGFSNWTWVTNDGNVIVGVGYFEGDAEVNVSITERNE